MISSTEEKPTYSAFRFYCIVPRGTLITTPMRMRMGIRACSDSYHITITITISTVHKNVFIDITQLSSTNTSAISSMHDVATFTTPASRRNYSLHLILPFYSRHSLPGINLPLYPNYNHPAQRSHRYFGTTNGRIFSRSIQSYYCSNICSSRSHIRRQLPFTCFS